MRGGRERQANIMLAVTPETFVPEDHPLRRIKPLVDDCPSTPRPSPRTASACWRRRWRAPSAGARRGVGAVRPAARPALREAPGGAEEGRPKPRKPVSRTPHSAEHALPASPEAPFLQQPASGLKAGRGVVDWDRARPSRAVPLRLARGATMPREDRLGRLHRRTPSRAFGRDCRGCAAGRYSDGRRLDP